MQKHPQLLALGKQLRNRREKSGRSKEAYASEAGLDRAYYGGVERGERNIASINLIQIAATLGVEVRDLFPSMKTLKKAK